MYIVDADGKRLNSEITALKKLSIHLGLFTRDPFKKINLDRVISEFDDKIENGSIKKIN